MKRFLAATLSLPMLLASLALAHADLAPPPLPAGQKAKFTVEVDDRADQPRLRIPKSLLQGGAKSGAKDEAGLPGLPTILAGAALTAAFVSGGFWLVRRGRGLGGAAAAVVLALSLLGMGASVVWGDIPRPPRPRGPVPLALPAGVQLSDNVVIEWVDKGDVITLVVNKKMVLDQKPAPSEDKNDKE